MPSPDGPRVVPCDRLPIELAQLLKLASLVQTGGEAKLAIREGQASVNGTVETRRGRKLVAGDVVTFGGQRIEIAPAEAG